MEDILDYKLVVGVIYGVLGVKGLVKIRCFTAHPTDMMDFSNIFDENGFSYKLRMVKAEKHSLVAGIDGISSRTAADTLVNRTLLIRRSELKSTKDEEYYYVDLLGASVLLSKDGDPSAANIGTISNIFNFGASDIIEVVSTYGDEYSYYPFIKKFVPIVNLKERYIVVRPIEDC